jgi:pimeloyl-ACP methyl ester carboxylesterase
MEFVQSKDGTRIAFARSGDGPPLLLVHGTLAERGRWNALLPLLGKKFTVYAMDRRGRGESSDGQTYALAREAEDIASVIEEVGSSVDVLAHSYGALCSLEASLLTGKVRRLALYEPLIRNEDVGSQPLTALTGIESMIARGDREAALRSFFREVFGTPDHEVERLSSLPYWQERLMVIHTAPREVNASRAFRFSPGSFKSMKAPTMLLLGGTSALPFRQAAELLQGGLASARISVLEDQNHHAMVTAPDLLASSVVNFLS